jgi:hypothetical protein
MASPARRVEHPSAWRRRDLETDRSWIIELDDEDRKELRSALSTARTLGVTADTMAAGTFPLPRVVPKLRRAVVELERGRGIAMLRGFPVDGTSLEDITMMYLGLGSHMGTRLTQTAEGIIVGHVSDLGYAYGKTNVRGYYTRAKLQFHTDNADLVGLLCVRRAKSGGLSSVSSTMSIYNEMLEHYPDELAQCLEGFHHDLKGENPPGVPPVTPHKVPVFSWHQDVLSSCFNTSYIEHGAIRRGVELSARERRTIDVVNSLAAREDLRLDFMCEPGDVQFINDHTTIHSRTEFVDHDDPAQKRLMLRLWLKVNDGRPMADAIADRGYGPGSARNGVPYFRDDAEKDPNSLRTSGDPSWTGLSHSLHEGNRA